MGDTASLPTEVTDTTNLHTEVTADMMSTITNTSLRMITITSPSMTMDTGTRKNRTVTSLNMTNTSPSLTVISPCTKSMVTKGLMEDTIITVIDPMATDPNTRKGTGTNLNTTITNRSTRTNPWMIMFPKKTILMDGKNKEYFTTIQ